MKQKLALEKSHLTKAAHDKATKALSQTTKQLDQARATVAEHTADFAHIEALLKDCKSMDEESSSSGESQGQGTPQQPPHKVKRRRSMTSK